MRSRALALKGAACVVAALAVAGCSQSGSGSSSSSAVTVTGKTLRIYISEPAHLSADPVAQDIIDAEELAFIGHYRSVTDYKLELVPVSDTKVSENARQAIQDTDAIAYIGELAPGDSDLTAGITNDVDLLQVSPTDTALELTQSTHAVTGMPEDLYESWSGYGQTFARVVPSSAQEATAQVAEMQSLGVSSLYVAHDSSDYGKALAYAVQTAAKIAGISAATSESGAGGIFYAGQRPPAAATFFKAAASSAPKAKLFGSSALNNPAFTRTAGSLPNLYVTLPGFMPQDLGAEGRGFEQAFQSKYHHKPNVEAIFGYEAMAQLLADLAKAGKNANNRSTVVSNFLHVSVPDSVLGSYQIGCPKASAKNKPKCTLNAGDTSLSAFVIARLKHGTLVPFKAAPTKG